MPYKNYCIASEREVESVQEGETMLRQYPKSYINGCIRLKKIVLVNCGI